MKIFLFTMAFLLEFTGHAQMKSMANVYDRFRILLKQEPECSVDHSEPAVGMYKALAGLKSKNGCQEIKAIYIGEGKEAKEGCPVNLEKKVEDSGVIELVMKDGTKKSIPYKKPSNEPKSSLNWYHGPDGFEEQFYKAKACKKPAEGPEIQKAESNDKDGQG